MMLVAEENKTQENEREIHKLQSELYEVRNENRNLSEGYNKATEKVNELE